MQAVISLAGSIDPSLGKMVEKVSGHLKKINWNAVAVGTAVSGVAVATGKAVADASKYLAELGNDWNKTMNQLSASTGATGEELEALGEAVKHVYAQNFGESMEDAAEALALVKKNSGLAGEELEKATTSAFALQDTFEYEVAESSRAAAALMKNFGLTAEEAYGLIATGAQNGADKNGDLLDVLNEYSGQYAALGLSADQFLDSLVAGADAGMFSIDKVGDAVKEFNIRAKDGSDSSAAAFSSLGLDADTMFSAFASGGEIAQAAFFDTVEALNKLTDPLQKNQIAVSLFGTQFEDLEAGILPVLAGIETAAYDGADALQKINDVKYNDLGNSIEQIKRTAETAILPLANTVFDGLNRFMPTLQRLMEQTAPILEQATEAAMPFVEEFLLGAAEALEDVMPLVAQLASDLFPILQQLLRSLLPPLLSLIQTLLPPLMEIISAILPPLSSLLSSILPLIVQIASSVLPVLVSLISGLLPVITPLLQVAVQILESVVMPLLPPLMQIVEALLPPLMAILGSVLPILTPVLKLLEPIASVLGVIADIIAKIVGFGADVLGGIFELFGMGGQPEAGISLPGYAAGGFTDGLSLAGEDFRYPTEAVISFNPAFRAQNLAYWAKAGQMLGASDEGLSYSAKTARAIALVDESGSGYPMLDGGTSTMVVYDLTGLSFSPQIHVDGDTDEDALIRKLRELEPEFIDFVLEALSRREEGAYVTEDNRLY